MNANANEPVAPRVMAEAADWMARLHARDEPDWDDPGLRQWLAIDSAHALALATVAGDWYAAEALPGADVVPLARPAPLRRLSSTWALAASLVLASLLWLFWPAMDARWQALGHDLVAAPGQFVQHTLADGSTLWLAPGSEVDFEAGSAGRRLTLAGQAVFEVRRDPTRPFVVAFDSGTVTVLGTRFGVDAGSRSAAVGVIRGRVRVTGPSGASRTLAAGQAARIEAGGVGEASFDPSRRFGWHQGRLVLDELSLAEALRQLQRYADRRVLLLGNDASAARVSAIIDTGRILPGIESIAGQVGYRVTWLPGIMLVHR